MMVHFLCVVMSLTCSLKKLGIEPLTLELADDCSTHEVLAALKPLKSFVSYVVFCFC